MDRQYKNGRNNNYNYYSLFNQMLPKIYNNTFNSKFGRRNRIFFYDMKKIGEIKKYSDYITSNNLFHNDCVGDFITGKKNQKIKMKKYKKWKKIIGHMKPSKFSGPNLPICSVDEKKKSELEIKKNSHML